jgi:glycosyltransferase involved in cell wall biosynthesis
MNIKKILLTDYTLSFLYSDIGKYPGGAAVEWYHWIKGFNKLNIKVGVLVLKGQKEIISKPLNYDLIETWDPESGFPKFKILFNVLPSFFNSIIRYKPDLIIQETARRETTILALISKVLGIKFIYRVASDIEVGDKINNYSTKFYTWFFNFGLKFANLILCQNKFQEEKLKEKFPRKKIELLTTPYSSDLKNKVKHKNERTYIAWIGSFRYIKNIQALLNVAQSLPNLKFKISGNRVPNHKDDETENALVELEKLSNVEFVKYMDYQEIPKFIEGAYALMNTSRSEGFSNTFLEAWAAGTPIVSTKNVNPNNIISDHNLGIIAGSYDELPGAIQKILDMSDSEYEEISNRCVKYLKENHDAKLLASKFLEYVEKL